MLRNKQFILCVILSLGILTAQADETLAASEVASPQVIELPQVMEEDGSEINFLPMPEPAVIQSIDFITGGVGLEESGFIKQNFKNFSLRLAFTEGREAAYVLDVALRILNAKGHHVFEIADSGPLLYVDLPKGRYLLVAEYKGRKQSQWITVSQKPFERAFFNWKHQAQNQDARPTVTQEPNPSMASDANDLSIP